MINVAAAAPASFLVRNQLSFTMLLHDHKKPHTESSSSQLTGRTARQVQELACQSAMRADGMAACTGVAVTPNYSGCQFARTGWHLEVKKKTSNKNRQTAQQINVITCNFHNQATHQARVASHAVADPDWKTKST